MLTVKFSSQFKKDYKRAIKQGKDIDHMFKVVDKLANGDVLSSKYSDHALKGKYIGFRECHLSSDWLLIYKIYDDVLVLLVSRLGSHSELF